MKLKLLLFILLVIIIFNTHSQSLCFSDCRERAIAAWEQLKVKGVTSTDSAIAINSKILAALKGCTFPDVELNKLDGGKVKIDELKNNVVFVHFWFVNCATCIAEMPSISLLEEQYENKNVKFLAISFNDKTTLQNFLKKHSTFKSIQTSMEQTTLEKTFCLLDGYPLNLILDKNGHVIDAWYEENPDSNKQRAFYDKVKTLIDSNL